MDTLRVKILAAFLAGMICTLGVLIIRNYIDQRRVEQQLQELPQRVIEPSHRYELSKPERWKV